MKFTATNCAGKTDVQLKELFTNEADLQAEFSSFENFHAYQRAAEKGLIAIIERSAEKMNYNSGLSAGLLRDLFGCDVTLQKEFQNAENFIAFYNAVQKGLVGVTQ